MNEQYRSLLKLCEGRRSVRNFSSRPVSEGDIRNIKRIAMTSPYASGRSNWDVVVVRERDAIEGIAAAVRTASANLLHEVRDDFAAHYERYAENFLGFQQAPVLFAPTFRVAPALSALVSEPDEALMGWERDNYVKSISCVAMLIILAAESLGLGSCYMTGPLLAEEHLHELIPVKTGREIGALIPVGHPEGADDGTDGD